MKTLLLYFLIVPIFLIGLFSPLKTVLAADVEVTWNDPLPILSGAPIKAESGVTWVNMPITGVMGYNASASQSFGGIGHEVYATIPVGKRVLGEAWIKLVYPGSAFTYTGQSLGGSTKNICSASHTAWEIYDYLNPTVPNVSSPVVQFTGGYDNLITPAFSGGGCVVFSLLTTSYRLVEITQEMVNTGKMYLTGSVSASACGNPASDMVKAIFIESSSPYAALACPDGYVSQNGICIQSDTQIQSHPFADFCKLADGYVYQDGICIKSSVAYTQVCGDGTAQPPTEECDGIDLSGCSINEYCIAPGLANQCTCAAPPTVTTLEPVDDYCSGTVRFKWTYSSAQNYSEAFWQVQVSTNSDFASGNIAYDSGKTQGSGTNVSVPVIYSPEAGHINYGVPYYWRVKVWDNKGYASVSGDNGYTRYTNSSTVPLNTYTFPYKHPGPAVSYTVDPASTTPGKKVSFTDNSSKCYNDYNNIDNGTYYNCSSNVENTYQWWYGDGNSTNVITCTKPELCILASHGYMKNNPTPYRSSLQICDDSGARGVGDDGTRCCSAFKDVTINPSTPNPVPNWWEISPY